MRWWLVPLTWVWAMVHGMWPVGIIIGLVALVGLALDRAVTRRQWLRLAAIPVLSVVAAGAHPRRAQRCTPRCSRSTREASTSPSGSRRTSRDGRLHRPAGPGRRRAASGCARSDAVISVDRAAAPDAGRRLGALHRPHRERGGHDARPLRRHARSRRRCASGPRVARWRARDRARRARSSAWRCWRSSSPGRRTSPPPRTRLVRRPSTTCRPAPPCSTTGARAAT